jgi:hypothetical protein
MIDIHKKSQTNIGMYLTKEIKEEIFAQHGEKLTLKS